jgi:ParB/RepB/Spo0J family partition protein
MKVKLEQIVQESPFQKRIPNPEIIQKLADAIVMDGGMKQRPRVRPLNGDHQYEIVFGHNRIAAARLLKWDDLEVDVEKLSDEQAHRLTIAENAHRNDLSPLEMALEMQDARKAFGLEETAKMFGVTESTVLSYLRILDLPIELMEKIHKGIVAKSAVSALVAYTRVAGPKAALEIVTSHEKNHGDAGSHQLIDSIKTKISWDKNYASLEDYNAHRVDMPYDKAYAVKDTLIWKPAKIMEMAHITDVDAYNQLYRLVTGGVNVLAQPFLGEPLTQKETEVATVAIMPPACDECPLRVVILGTAYCTMKLCLIRKRKSWVNLQFVKYMKSSGLTKYSESKDGIGLPIDINLKDKDDPRQAKLVEMMKDPATTLRIREHNNTEGVYIGTKNKYAQLVDCSKKASKVAAENKVKHVESRSRDDYYSPENVERRRNEEAVGNARRNAYTAFIREKIIDLILPVMKISIPEMAFLFGGIDDKNIKENFGIKKVTEANRLELYRRYFLVQNHRFNSYEAAQHGVLKAVQEEVLPLLKELEIALPDGFDDILKEYVAQGDVIDEKDDPEEEDEEDGDGEIEEEIDDEEE